VSPRGRWLGLAALAVAVLAALMVWRAVRARSTAEEQAVASEVPVHVGKVTRATVHRVVVTVGTVEAEPAQADRPAASARVGSPVTGIVASVSCAEGERVERGAALVHLDARVADAQVRRAAEAVEFAELALARQRKMAPSEATSQKALEEAELQLAAARSELETARAERELLVIKAPLAGTLVHLAARPGDAVDPSTVLAEIVDLRRLVVSAGVRSAEAGLLKVGQPVELSGAQATTGDAASKLALAGTLAFVGAQVDTKTDTIPVRVSLPVVAGLRPGEFLDVRITVEVRADRLVVPEEAVVSDGEGGSAIALVDGDSATLRSVKVGLREGGLVEVEGDGIREGVSIVTEGAYGLPKETKIKVIGP
jgi:membrane fusion protein (multidrug efflux system)